jgi:hypothetical protein
MQVRLGLYVMTPHPGLVERIFELAELALQSLRIDLTTGAQRLNGDRVCFDPTIEFRGAKQDIGKNARF